jgi:hypothetical protein
MIRTTLAAAALVLLVAAPALAQTAPAQEVRIQALGKSPAELHHAIISAARSVCAADTRSDSLSLYTFPACMQASVKDAVRQARSPELAAYNAAHASEVRMASR